MEKKAFRYGGEGKRKEEEGDVVDFMGSSQPECLGIHSTDSMKWSMYISSNFYL